MMQSVRTPEARFQNLPNFDGSPHYLEDLPVAPGLRLHYLDEGPHAAKHTFLCLHGQPTWAYLYRKMIPVFVEAGGRVVAPDFFGFGRSDKPVDDAVYTFDFHRDTIRQVVERLDLKDVTLVCQDWGGLAGLTVPMDMPERFTRLIVMNTALATGVPPSDAFLAWRDHVRSRPDFDVGRLMKRAVPGLTDAEVAAYDAPFVDVTSKAGVRRFPEIVPIDKTMAGVEHSIRAAAWWKNEWKGQSFMAIGLQDPVLGKVVMDSLRKTIAGCPEPLELPDAGHFVQEMGEVVARAALESFGG